MELNKRIWGYDLIKAMACYLIVLYHMELVDFEFAPGFTYYPSITKWIWTFCVAGVPLFFMINGALTINKYTFKRAINKIIRLIFVAVFWTIVFKLLFYDFLLKHSLDFSLIRFKDYYWFFYTLAALYLIDQLLRIIPKWCEKLLLALIFVFPFLTNLLWVIILFFYPEITLPSWGHTGAFTMYSIFYHRIGYYLKEKNIPWQLSLFLIIIGVCIVVFEVFVRTNHDNTLYDGVNASFPTIGALSLSSGFFLLLKNLDISCAKIKTVVSFIGSCSLGIYLFQFPLIVIIHRLISAVTLSPFLVVLLTLVTIIISSVLTNFLSKSRMSFLIKI